MIQFQDEKPTREADVPAQYPAYYRGYVYNRYFVAVLSDTLAIKVSVVPSDVFIRKGTPDEMFRTPSFNDYQPVDEGQFLKALKLVESEAKQVKFGLF